MPAWTGDVLGQTPAPAPGGAPSGDVNLAPNPRFGQARGQGQGDDRPAAWKIARGNGRWRDRQSLEIAGSGKDAEYWQSEPIAFTPGAIYRFSMGVRRTSGGGSVIAGPAFANRDYADVTDRVQRRSHCFWVPERRPRVTCGWGCGRERARADLRTFASCPSCRYTGSSAALCSARASRFGKGDTFSAPRSAAKGATTTARSWRNGRVQQRPLVLRRRRPRDVSLRLPDVTFRAAEVGFNVNYHIRGGCTAEASRDGKTWRPIAAQGKLGARSARCRPNSSRRDDLSAAAGGNARERFR